MGWLLEVIDGPNKSCRFESAHRDTVLIGRAATAAFRLPEHDLEISRVHCLLEIDGEHCTVRDLNSSRGTRLNGQGISQEEPVEHGDLLQLGSATVIRITVLPGAKSPPADIYCIRCRKCVTGEVDRLGMAGPEREWLAYKCQSCQREEQAERAHAAVSPLRIICELCHADITALADSDGRARELLGIVSYLCPACGNRLADARLPAAGDHRLLGMLGHGAMGQVFKAWHSLTGRVVAFKMMLTDLRVADPRPIGIFFREMAIHKELRHPGVVRWLDSGLLGARPFLVSELMLGGSLLDLLTRRKASLPPREATAYIIAILDALHAMHQRSFVHRDIKPGNLLLTRDPDAGGELAVVKLGDFGLARSFAEVGASFLTAYGESGGTLPYMSEEQIRDYRRVGPTADVYAVGITLYQLLCGRFPFQFAAGHPIDMQLDVVAAEHRRPLQSLNPHVPFELAAVVDKAVRLKQTERYQTALELKTALQQAFPRC